MADAEVLPHPDRDRDFSKRIFHLRYGSIAIKTHNGEPMTYPVASLLLDQAKLIIVDESLDA